MFNQGWGLNMKMNFKKITVALLASTALCGAAQADVKVGVLQSLSGTMAISEVTVKNAEMMAIDKSMPPAACSAKRSCRSWKTAHRTRRCSPRRRPKLIQSDDVVTVFGGWTSASRKAMLPVFERFKEPALVSGAVRGQRVLARHHVFRRAAQPADPAGPPVGRDKRAIRAYFLLGSDYVFPRTANLILKKHIEHGFS